VTYDEFPIEQVARSVRSRFQRGFARLTMHMLPDFDDAAYEPSIEGLRILGTSEIALRVPVEIVRQIHGGDVAVEPPRVRLSYHGRVCEPVMGLRITLDGERVQRVVDDLLARGAALDEVDRRHGRTTLRATGRLRTLLGYPEALACLAGDACDLVMWLCHYTEARNEALQSGARVNRLRRPRRPSRRAYAAPGPLSASGR
jgi:predicted membrane GTPase involved in stress response